MADDEPVADLNVGAFDPSKKKKKKKKTSGDALDESSEVTQKLDELKVSEGVEASEPVGDGEDLSLTLSKKKKKKKKDRDEKLTEEEAEEEGVDTEQQQGEEGVDEADLEADFGEDEEAQGIELGGAPSAPATLPWEGSDRDYLYQELLDRVFHILRENNPELAGEKRRTSMRPPQVLREGTKKTVFVNFMDLCKTMHRQPEHVMAFLLAELGTSGSLDGQQRLIVKGRFAPKNFEGILRRYVNEYVLCSGCKSPDTTLSKENRLFFLRCEQCGSHRSVAPIKAGFVARVGRRKGTA